MFTVVFLSRVCFRFYFFSAGTFRFFPFNSPASPSMHTSSAAAWNSHVYLSSIAVFLLIPFYRSDTYPPPLVLVYDYNSEHLNNKLLTSLAFCNIFSPPHPLFFLAQNSIIPTYLHISTYLQSPIFPTIPASIPHFTHFIPLFSPRVRRTALGS
ncbi:hypothetical protein BDN70DRAFT_822290 [Pholiota conissans]|uniref:Uncharacterized protein n=1 Tax=Pholiota conissans TaxID=109636 RepID=A0A9P5ZEE2_9AGAR|nr:hypothetical protein BDN70DRAFT_822290 [Pholiota conissans]